MTTKQTLLVLKSAGKPVSLVHLYRLFKVIGIRPLGHSRPQLYPADTAERIKQHLGISAAVSGATSPRINSGRPAALISTRALRAAKANHKNKK